MLLLKKNSEYLDMYVYDAKIFLFFMKQFKKTWY